MCLNSVITAVEIERKHEPYAGLCQNLQTFTAQFVFPGKSQLGKIEQHNCVPEQLIGRVNRSTQITVFPKNWSASKIAIHELLQSQAIGLQKTNE